MYNNIYFDNHFGPGKHFFIIFSCVNQYFDGFISEDLSLFENALLSYIQLMNGLPIY